MILSSLETACWLPIPMPQHLLPSQVTAPGLQKTQMVQRPKCPHPPWQNRYDSEHLIGGSWEGWAGVHLLDTEGQWRRCDVTQAMRRYAPMSFYTRDRWYGLTCILVHWIIGGRVSAVHICYSRSLCQDTFLIWAFHVSMLLWVFVSLILFHPNLFTFCSCPPIRLPMA